MSNDSTLRKSLIRLAHAEPQLRAALLPLFLKRAEFKMSPADQKVLDAFIDKKSADSKKLSTDGKTLDGNWMGGKGIAVWEGGKIHLEDTGGKSGQTIQRAIRKLAPRNLVAAFRDVTTVSSQAVVAKRMARSFIRKLARMSDEARELELFIENDGQLYRQQYAPIIQNLMRKRNKGKYDFALSIKLFMYLADAGAKKYHAEFGTPGTPWNEVFPKATRMEVAKSLAESFQAEAEAGGYDKTAVKRGGLWFRINPDDAKADKVLEGLARRGIQPAPYGKGPGVKNITDFFFHLSPLDAQRIPGLARYRISADWESFDSGALESVEYKIVAGTSGRSRKLVYRGSYVVYGQYGETTVPVEGSLNLSELDEEHTSIEDFVLDDIQAYLDENPELYDMGDDFDGDF